MVLATQKADQNRAAFDPWTAVHLSAGLALGLTDVPRRWALAASVAYEVAEQVFERRDWGKGPVRDERAGEPAERARGHGRAPGGPRARPAAEPDVTRPAPTTDSGAPPRPAGAAGRGGAATTNER